MKVKTRGNQAFNVPNDQEGQDFLRLLRKFRNRGWYYRARGRGPRKEKMIFSEELDDYIPVPDRRYSLPQEEAEWLAVYLEQKRDWTFEDAVRPGALLDTYNTHSHESLPVKCQGSAGIFVVPKQIVEMKIAEWSDPFIAGSPVAIDKDGQAYNSAPHGLQPGTQNIGFAVAESKGSIGEGEGKVQLELNAINEPEPIKTNIAFYEGMDLSAFCGCDDKAGFVCSDHRKEEEEDVTDITEEELKLLRDVLDHAAQYLPAGDAKMAEDLKEKFT